jgi:ribosomal protein L35
MPFKFKTHKTVSKRVRVTKRGKLLKRKGGQDHFNSRESSKVTRNKRRDQSINGKFVKNIKQLI